MVKPFVNISGKVNNLYTRSKVYIKYKYVSIYVVV